MRHWRIPAKTFLVGEYVALSGGPAILLTTDPCFEVSWLEKTERAFHPNAPAGRFCDDHGLTNHLSWFDPYHGFGGLGASSAEFVGSFRAYCEVVGRSFVLDELLASYWHYAWSQKGVRPSGYDVIAQTLEGCVLIHEAKKFRKACAWPFSDIGFILIHTRHKLATHHHLENVVLNSPALLELYDIAHAAKAFFEATSSADFVQAVQAYHNALDAMSLITSTTTNMIETLSSEIRPLAIKGCGALGADVILMLVEQERLSDIKNTILSMKHTIVGTSEQIHIK